MAKTGIERDVPFTFKAVSTVAFCAAIFWFVIVLASTSVGGMPFGFEAPFWRNVVSAAPLQSALLFVIALNFWLLWDMVPAIGTLRPFLRG